MTLEVLAGLLIPLFGTTLVAACVFLQAGLQQFLLVDQISRIISPLFPSKFRIGSVAG